MEQIGEIMQRLLKSMQVKQSFDEILEKNRDVSPRDMQLRMIDRFNHSEGHMNDEDGFNCEKCKNRGYFAVLNEQDGFSYEYYKECKCVEIRRSIRRMKASGLESVIKKYTFDKFKTDTPWHKKMYDTAMAFLESGVSGKNWLFMGGAVGCGKSHICTAVCGKLLYKMPVYYMVWQTEMDALKVAANDDEEYNRIMYKLKNIECLYIDDFYKPVSGMDGNPLPPSPTDARRTADIINYRSMNNLITIISTERYLSELAEMDEGTASRIAERAKNYCVTIGRDHGKNHRLIFNDETV